jgi:hypothetical protein
MIVLHSGARSSCSIAALPPSTTSFSSSFVGIRPSTHEISALQPPVGMHVSESALAGPGTEACSRAIQPFAWLQPQAYRSKSYFVSPRNSTPRIDLSNAATLSLQTPPPCRGSRPDNRDVELSTAKFNSPCPSVGAKHKRPLLASNLGSYRPVNGSNLCQGASVQLQPPEPLPSYSQLG